MKANEEKWSPEEIAEYNAHMERMDAAAQYGQKFCEEWNKQENHCLADIWYEAMKWADEHPLESYKGTIRIISE